eukprot:GGOE01059009.1.p1 GENE.GGOE01059009.1~~GGOE01059009.1.p1  ORF type:complete len:392 (-),score=128.77 GGOE01059009.1:123-1298(-)
MPDTMALAAADDFNIPDAAAVAQVVSLRERTLQTTQVRLMQEVKKLEATVAMLRSRNAKLQDEVVQKEQQAQDLIAQQEKAEDSIDELSHMVQVLQYQLSSTTTTVERRPGHNRDVAHIFKPGALSLLQALEVKRSVGQAVRPLGKRVRSICADYGALRQFALDKLAALQRSFQADGASLLQFLSGFVAKSQRPLPPPPPAASNTRGRPRFPSFLEPEVIIEPCTQPHLSEGAVSSLEAAAGRLNLSVSRLSTVAGIPLELVMMPPSRNLYERLGDVESVISRLQKRAEKAAERLCMKLARTHPEPSVQDLRRVEEEEEEIEQRVVKCTDLLLKSNGNGDPALTKELFAAFVKVEESIETRHKEPAPLMKADKGCQCSIIVVSRESNGAVW